MIYDCDVCWLCIATLCGIYAWWWCIISRYYGVIFRRWLVVMYVHDVCLGMCACGVWWWCIMVIYGEHARRWCIAAMYGDDAWWWCMIVMYYCEVRWLGMFVMYDDDACWLCMTVMCYGAVCWWHITVIHSCYACLWYTMMMCHGGYVLWWCIPVLYVVCWLFIMSMRDDIWLWRMLVIYYCDVCWLCIHHHNTPYTTSTYQQHA